MDHIDLIKDMLKAIDGKGHRALLAETVDKMREAVRLHETNHSLRDHEGMTTKQTRDPVRGRNLFAGTGTLPDPTTKRDERMVY